MTKTFTQNDAILYVYGELNDNVEKEFEKALLQNEALREEVFQLQELQWQLEGAALSPSQKTLDNILSHAKSFNLHL